MTKKSVSTAGKGACANGRQARATAAREAIERATRRERRRQRLLMGIGVGVVTAVAVAGGVVLGSSRSSSPTVAIPSSPRTTAEGRTTTPPWPAPANPASAVRAAGLPMLGEEGAVEHIHAHLDVLVNGQKVPVPEGIGVDRATNKISPLHSHDGTGVIHVESPVKASFSLGQLFTQWQVSLGVDHIGGLRAEGDKLLRAYVNGKPTAGDPAGIILSAHDEIAVVYGNAAQQANPPASYNFPKGE